MNENIKKGLVMAGVIGGSFLVVGTASAAMPQAATTAFTTLGNDLQSMVASLWDIAVPVTMGFLYLKFFKKAAKSAT